MVHRLRAFERGRNEGILRASQRAFIESVVSRYGVDAVFYLPVSRQISPVGGMRSRSATNLFVWLLVVLSG